MAVAQTADHLRSALGQQLDELSAKEAGVRGGDAEALHELFEEQGKQYQPPQSPFRQAAGLARGGA